MEKKEFEFYQDVKVTVWQRQHFRIEAESAEEAREIAKQYANQDISFLEEVEVEEIEWLYDTEEHIIPEENGGCSTIEVYERLGKYKGDLIADNAKPGLSAISEERKILGYQIYDEDGDYPEGLFSFMVFKTREDAQVYINFYELVGYHISEYYEGDIEDPTFIGMRVFKKGERVYNDFGSLNDSDLTGWGVMCEDELEIYSDQVVLMKLDSGSEIETQIECVYKIAEGKRCPQCGGQLCLNHDTEFDNPYYCPECFEVFKEYEVK